MSPGAVLWTSGEHAGGQSPCIACKLIKKYYYILAFYISMTSLYSTDGVIVYNIHKSKLEHAAQECTLYLARCTVGSNHSVVEDLNGSATLDSILGCLLHIIYLLESCLLNIIYFFESCLLDSIYLWGRVFYLPGKFHRSVSCLSTWYRYHLSVSKSVYLISSICE